jgi:hypothetical protein
MTKDTSIIPKGDYCYTWKEVPSESNNYRGKVNQCPYYDVKNVNGVEFPWCNYLELGGTPGDGTIIPTQTKFLKNTLEAKNKWKINCLCFYYLIVAKNVA